MNDFHEFNENEGTTYPNLWESMKAVLRGKFRALSDYRKKSERCHNSNLKVDLKALGKKKQAHQKEVEMLVYAHSSFFLRHSEL